MGDRRFDAIVIGAGFGGASCAGLLARAGRKVLVIEKNNLAGGKTMSHARKGFRYSPWPIIAAPLEGSWASRLVADLGIGARARLVKVEGRSMYRAPDGSCAPLPSSGSDALDPDVLFDWLRVPEAERASVLAFMTRLSLMPPDEVGQLEGRDFHDWVQPFGLPASVHAFLVSNCLDDMYMVPSDQLDCAEAISGLQKVLLGGGGQFCLGGWGVLAEACCAYVHERGGEVLTGTRVQRILIENGAVVGVETGDGAIHRSSTVISNAGIQPTVLQLAGARFFDADYAGRIGKLMPSHALVGYRYFLSEPVLDYGYSVIFSNTSAWTRQRFEDAHAGKASREGFVLVEVPSNYDPEHASPGRQLVMSASMCPADPELGRADVKAWADAGEAILFATHPELANRIEEKVLYTARSVSNATRDPAVPGAGGETIGIAQIVGQTGRGKPSIKTPVEGLWIVGCDAGGTGVGTQQAIESGYAVAEAVLG